MSLGIYPVFEAKLTGTKFESLGERLAANFEVLDKIAYSAGLVPFTAFGDNRPIPKGFDGNPDELDDLMGKWNEWFDPTEGQNAMQALANQIKTDPKAAKQLDDTMLELAQKQGIRFRLEMS
jgi:hypothetical protein